MKRPMASSAVYPNNFSAAGFHEITLNCSSTVTMAVVLSSSTDW
jgi:hypothetical protein